MRQHKAKAAENTFSILALDDDPIMTSTVQAYFQRSGYHVDVENNPLQAIERVRNGQYDILLLDFLMTPICGDQVVEEIRKFNRELFIILLTGHKTMAPPIRTIRALDIQGYYEKSDRFDQLELLVESCVKSIRQMRTIQSYQNGLSSIMEALPGIYQLQSAEHIMENVIQEVTGLLHCTGSVLVLDLVRCGMRHDEAGTRRYLSSAAGTQVSAPEESALEPLFQELEKNGRVTAEKKMTFPLTNGTQAMIGFLSVELKEAVGYDHLQLLEVFTRQVSAALSNIFLHELVQEKSKELDRAYSRLRNNYAEIITTVRDIVDAKDFYTRNHSDRVSFYAVELARRLGRSETYCTRLKVAGLFHDIGKLSIPDEILSKADTLTDEEFAVIKTHPVRGEKLLSGITGFHDILPTVRAHHERYDGHGYPDQLAGTDISEQARIITVADSFDAMTSDRRYRDSLGFERAIEELKREKGGQFDPALVDVFVGLVEEPGFLERAAKADHQGYDAAMWDKIEELKS
ncbi:HD domain-containing response regulator [Oscillibacter sp.]|uniref:response regulator n=1 Tax=Oscillibacter sp. TaxID=1945593 RepID=UPI00260CF70A|nr:HD domain-containing response regulator [Oscillibacter sp.]MDD3347417.1 HD domain-containing response regulator [Oscillibacter sp.]